MLSVLLFFECFSSSRSKTTSVYCLPLTKNRSEEERIVLIGKMMGI